MIGVIIDFYVGLLVLMVVCIGVLALARLPYYLDSRQKVKKAITHISSAVIAMGTMYIVGYFVRHLVFG